MAMEYSAHLDTILTAFPVQERIKLYAKFGLKAFELWCWWEPKYDMEMLKQVAADNNQKVAAICTKFVPLTESSSHDEYLKGLEETIEAADKLACKTIISQVGKDYEEYGKARQIENIITGLKRATSLLEETNITLVIEPLNVLINHAGYFLSASHDAAEILQAVNSPKVKMLFDVYHQQISEGNLINNIRTYASLIGHYHIADVPGRHQPGTGEICYRHVLDAIRETGFDGYIGMEFLPTDKIYETIEKFLIEYPLGN